MLDLYVINNITKEYPDMIKVVIYKEPHVFVRSGVSKRSNHVVDSSRFMPEVSSLNRTKTLVRDIVLCNDFELFCTFTFNPDKIDRFSFIKCSSSMRTWLHHQADNSREAGKEFKYIVIPEQHKSGAWHFHALISGYVGSLKDSRVRSSSGRVVYNMTSYRSGFTTAVPIDSKEAVSNYVTKYITKDFIRLFNKRRFFCSRNLIRPSKVINSDKFSLCLPVLRRKVSEDFFTETYILPVDF